MNLLLSYCVIKRNVIVINHIDSYMCKCAMASRPQNVVYPAEMHSDVKSILSHILLPTEMFSDHSLLGVKS